MDWKKIAESKDLIVFEKQLKKHKVKIEARKSEKGWEVFKTQVKGNASNLISEYSLDNKTQVKKLIQALKKGLDPKPRIIRRSSSGVSLKRIFKEEFLEKWHFNVGSDKIKNILFARYDDSVNVDILLHDKYKKQKRVVLTQIEEILGLKDMGELINYELFYFSDQDSTKVSKKEIKYPLNHMDIEFDFSDEYY